MIAIDAYVEVMEQAAEWIGDHQALFALPALDDPRFVSLLKPLGELALTADVILSRSATLSLSLRAAGNDWLNYCWKQLNEGELLQRVVVEHPDLIVVAALYPVFHKRGLRCMAFEQTIGDLVQLRAIAALELPAWRQLELATAFDALSIGSPWDRDAALRGTWLYAMPEPWLVSEAGAYSLTHTVFYETGFGSVPLRLSSKLRTYLTFWVPVWIQYYEGIPNYDLLSEMVMVMRCLGVANSDGWGQSLRDWQEADGMLRGPAVRRGLDPAEASQRRRRFLDNYHTTLVGLMACAMTIHLHHSKISEVPTGP